MLYTLLLIDDEAEIRNGLSSYFPWQEIGFDLRESFSSAEKALAYLENHSTDVILSDIKMPGLSGLELARIVHERYPATRMLFLSGHTDFEYAKKALEYGVKFYIVKPVMYQELVDVFTKVKFDLTNELQKKLQQSIPQSVDNIGGSYYDKIIYKVENYIKQNCGTVTLESAASYVNMNPYYLSSFFKQHAKIKFSDYVLETKMHKAAAMLSDPTLKIYEVSLAVGYQNANNFCRAFRTFFHCSPRDYRLREQNDDRGMS